MAFKLTDEQVRALYHIWEQIAGDVFEACGEDTLRRDEVIELVLDASRPEHFHPEIDWTEFNTLPYMDRVKLCRSQVFEYHLYSS